jgi:hypothetical protein
MIVFAIVLGGIFGMALALMREIVDRRVRGAADLAQAIGIPVWGVLEDTSALARPVDRKTRKALKRGALLKPVREPVLGLRET